MRNTVRAGAAGIACAVIVLGASACGGGGVTEKTLHFKEKYSPQTNLTFFDNPPKSPTTGGEPQTSRGDTVAFTGRYVDSSGKLIGRFDGSCTVGDGGKGFAQSGSACSYIATLPGGQLFVAIGGKINTAAIKGAVVGGTGKYEGATGSFSSIGEANSEDTFHIFLPKK